MRGIYRITGFLLFAAVAVFFAAPAPAFDDSSPGDAKVVLMVKVPKSWFKMGYDEGELNERPEHAVFVDTFFIDVYQVTAEQFAKFLNEQGNPEEKYFSMDKYSNIKEVNEDGQEVDKTSEEFVDSIFVTVKGYEQHPANNVSWYGAYAYCRWKEKRLLSEAEWEKVASGGKDNNLYPWGDEEPDETKACYNRDWDTWGLDAMVPVTSFPDSVSSYEVYNMAGNVWEWVNDWYRQNYCDFCNPYSMDYTDTTLKLEDLKGRTVTGGEKEEHNKPHLYNPKGPLVGGFKALRGGSWYDSFGEQVIRTSYRFWLNPFDRYLNTGFRCGADKLEEKEEEKQKEEQKQQQQAQSAAVRLQ